MDTPILPLTEKGTSQDSVSSVRGLWRRPSGCSLIEFHPYSPEKL
jgi:hypothetical protein